MKRSTTGSTLLAVIFIMVIVASLAGIVLTMTTHVSRLGKRMNERTQAIAYGDAVLESLFDQWRQAMISATNDTDRKQGLTSSALSGLTAPSTGVLMPPENISLGSFSVVAATPLLVAMPGGGDRPLPENGTRTSLRARLHYLATAQINFPGPTALNATVTVQRDFVRAGKNIFDNFYFGTQKATEMHPGAPMYISGTCYVGGDLYTAHDYLHYLKDVTYTGTHTIDYRPEDSRKGTAPTILNGGLGDNWDLNNQPHVGSEQKLFDVKLTDLDPRFVDDPLANDANSTSGPYTSYNGVNDDGFHEIIEEYKSPGADPLQLDNPTNPSGGSPTNSERLVAQADYRIEVDKGNTVLIYKGASPAPITSGADFTAITDALTTDTALKDVREGDNVRVVTLDVGKIAAAYSTNKITDNVGSSDGLTFYIKDTSRWDADPKVDTTLAGTGTVKSKLARGVKLVNGATLPYNTANKTGFTVISPNSVYIQGDYNTGTTASLKPASNTATSYTPPNDTPSPVVSGYPRAPSAVVGDAVSILSNAWLDSNSTSSGPNGSGPTASNTTVNCAIVAGNVPTTTASYSGGIENFARFLEDWSGGKYFTVYGALALLYNSEVSTQPWNKAVYSPPNRRWYYDPLLQDTNPPGFRIARSYERGRRVIR